MESVYNLGGGGAEAPGGAPPRRGVKAVPQAGGVPMHRNSSQVRPPPPATAPPPHPRAVPPLSPGPAAPSGRCLTGGEMRRPRWRTCSTPRGARAT